MADARLTATVDDDIPRTFKRAREAKEREEREARDRLHRAPVEPEWRDRERDSTLGVNQQQDPAAAVGSHAEPPLDRRVQRAVVTAFEVPFFRLTFFLIKVVLAGIPALLLLTALLWLFGQGVASFAPELLKMKILVTFPGGQG